MLPAFVFHGIPVVSLTCAVGTTPATRGTKVPEEMFFQNFLPTPFRAWQNKNQPHFKEGFGNMPLLFKPILLS